MGNCSDHSLLPSLAGIEGISVGKIEEGKIISLMTEWPKELTEKKRAHRAYLAALPFSEKIKLLEKMRQRELLIRRSRQSAKAPPPVPESEE